MTTQYFLKFAKFLSGDFQEFSDLLVCYEIAKLSSRLLYGECNRKNGVFQYAKQQAFIYAISFFKNACLDSNQIKQLALISSKVTKINSRCPYQDSKGAKTILNFLRLRSEKDADNQLPHTIALKCSEKKLFLKEPLIKEEGFQFAKTEEGIKAIDQLDTTYLLTHNELIANVNPFLGRKTMREPILDIESLSKKTKLTNTIEFIKDSMNAEIDRKTQDIYMKTEITARNFLQPVQQNFLLAETIVKDPPKSLSFILEHAEAFSINKVNVSLEQPAQFIETENGFRIPLKTQQIKPPKPELTEGEMLLKRVSKLLHLESTSEPEKKEPTSGKKIFFSCKAVNEISFSLNSNEEILFSGFGSLLHPAPTKEFQISEKTRKRIRAIRENICGIKTKERGENICLIKSKENEELKLTIVSNEISIIREIKSKKMEVRRGDWFMLEKEFKDPQFEEQLKFSGISSILRAIIPSLLECLDRVFFAYGDDFISQYRPEEIEKFPAFVKKWVTNLRDFEQIAATSTFWAEELPFNVIKKYMNSYSKDIEFLFFFIDKINCSELVESVLSFGASIVVLENDKYVGNKKICETLQKKKETELMLIAEKANKLKLKAVLKEAEKEFNSFKKIISKKK